MLSALLAAVFLLPSAGWARQVVDQAGRAVEVPDRPARVVALAPNITEMVFELERGDRLVGATQYSNHPEAAARLPRVGSYVRLDLERIMALEPDLCIAIRDGNPAQAVERLTSMGVPVYVVDPRSLDEIMATMLEIGLLLDAEARAGLLVAEMRRRIDRVGQRLAAVKSRPAVFFQLDFNPIISAGPGTFIDELIVLAGGRNLAAANRAVYPRFTWEEILVLAPEVVVITRMAGGLGPEELVRRWQQWPRVPAVARDRVRVVEADLFDRATSRLVAGLEELAAIIHPEVFDQ